MPSCSQGSFLQGLRGVIAGVGFCIFYSGVFGSPAGAPPNQERFVLFCPLSHLLAGRGVTYLCLREKNDAKRKEALLGGRGRTPSICCGAPSMFTLPLSLAVSVPTKSCGNFIPPLRTIICCTCDVHPLNMSFAPQTFVYMRHF